MQQSSLLPACPYRSLTGRNRRRARYRLRADAVQQVAPSNRSDDDAGGQRDEASVQHQTDERKGREHAGDFEQPVVAVQAALAAPQSLHLQAGTGRSLRQFQTGAFLQAAGEDGIDRQVAVHQPARVRAGRAGNVERPVRRASRIKRTSTQLPVRPYPRGGAGRRFHNLQRPSRRTKRPCRRHESRTGLRAIDNRYSLTVTASISSQTAGESARRSRRLR